MELKQLTTEILRIFNVPGTEKLGEALLKCVMSNDEIKMNEFCNLVKNDLSKDWLQMIYQYYLAEREQKKQDYTPKCLVALLDTMQNQYLSELRDAALPDLMSGKLEING